VGSERDAGRWRRGGKGGPARVGPQGEVEEGDLAGYEEGVDAEGRGEIPGAHHRGARLRVRGRR